MLIPIYAPCSVDTEPQWSIWLAPKEQIALCPSNRDRVTLVCGRNASRKLPEVTFQLNKPTVAPSLYLEAVSIAHSVLTDQEVFALDSLMIELESICIREDFVTSKVDVLKETDPEDGSEALVIVLTTTLPADKAMSTWGVISKCAHKWIRNQSSNVREHLNGVAIIVEW